MWQNMTLRKTFQTVFCFEGKVTINFRRQVIWEPLVEAMLLAERA